MDVTAEQVYDLAPYARTLGVVFKTIQADQVVATLAYDHAISTVGGGIHGGALMALADITAAVLATAASGGALPATTQSSTHFLQPVTGDTTAKATAIKVGRSHVVVDVEVRDGEGALGLRVTQIVALVRR